MTSITVPRAISQPGPDSPYTKNRHNIPSADQAHRAWILAHAVKQELDNNKFRQQDVLANFPAIAKKLESISSAEAVAAQLEAQAVKDVFERQEKINQQLGPDKKDPTLNEVRKAVNEFIDASGAEAEAILLKNLKLEQLVQQQNEIAARYKLSLFA